MPKSSNVINLVRRKRPRAGRVIQKYRRLVRRRESREAREEFLKPVCRPDVNQGVSTDQIPETPVAIDPLKTNSEESELTEEVPLIDLSFDSDSEAENIVDFKNCPEIQISSTYGLYHESIRPMPKIKILEDKILPALERVDLRQFFSDIRSHPMLKRKIWCNKFWGW